MLNLPVQPKCGVAPDPSAHAGHNDDKIASVHDSHKIPVQVPVRITFGPWFFKIEGGKIVHLNVLEVASQNFGVNYELSSGNSLV